MFQTTKRLINKCFNKAYNNLFYSWGESSKKFLVFFLANSHITFTTANTTAFFEKKKKLITGFKIQNSKENPNKSYMDRDLQICPLILGSLILKLQEI